MAAVVRQRHTSLAAFTLIELLVVIAIISLLLSILLPSMASAHRTSRGVNCLANMRSLGQGWQMYADDHDGIALPSRPNKLPGGASNPDNWYDVGNGLKYRPRWIATMGKYVGIPAYAAPTVDDIRQDYDSRVYHCPTVPGWTDERNTAYGYNHHFLGNPRQANGVYRNFPVSLSSLGRLADTVLAADAMGTAAAFARDQRASYSLRGGDTKAMGNHGYTIDAPRLLPTSDRGTGTGPRSAVDPRHNQKTNVIFCDGHGSPMTPEALGYRVEDDGSYVEGGAPNTDGPTNNLFSGTGRDDDPPENGV